MGTLVRFPSSSPSPSPAGAWICATCPESETCTLTAPCERHRAARGLHIAEPPAAVLPFRAPKKPSASDLWARALELRLEELKPRGRRSRREED